MRGERTFAGFGFGPIQAGLFALEAWRSGRHWRLAFAEVDRELVESVRSAGGRVTVNIAHLDRVEAVTFGPVELFSLLDAAERRSFVEVLAEAEEGATALPSVKAYTAGAPHSCADLVAEAAGLAPEGTRVIYCAENHPQAAALLKEAVRERLVASSDEEKLESLVFLDTVIGKMSGALPAGEARERGLAPLAPGAERAYLVEAFNRIFVSAPPHGAEELIGIPVLEPKPDLRPYEDAKLYGHNAVHAAAAYLALRAGLRRMDELAFTRGAPEFLRAAFVEEVGPGILKRHRGLDTLFTPEGWGSYAEDLIARMLNPHLGDRVERVARDPERKLGWNDRLVGAMRLALEAGVRPRRLALGAAAAAEILLPGADRERLCRFFEWLWGSEPPDMSLRDIVLEEIGEAINRLRSAPPGDVFRLLS